MRKEANSSRRAFLHQCAICAGAMALPPAWAALLIPSQRPSARQVPLSKQSPVSFQYLASEQVLTVEAVTEQIIPADDEPGAKWAGVVHYIDLGLAGKFRRFRPLYEAGLKQLGSLAQTRSSKAFWALDFSTQKQLLEKLEQDTSSVGGGPSGAEFFKRAREDTLCGFFGEPKYGGNKEFIGWKILKFTKFEL
jgi:gluconate 2-dehydrogenase gamma chain